MRSLIVCCLVALASVASAGTGSEKKLSTSTQSFFDNYIEWAFEQDENMTEELAGEMLFEEATPEMLEEIFGLPTHDPENLSGLSDEEVNYILENNPEGLIQKSATGLVYGTLNKRNGKFYWDVQTPRGSYSCLASPGKSLRTPKFQGKIPYGTERLHIVSNRKSYAGAKMPFTVWISGGFATHAGVVTGYRESHGCIRIACAEKFYNDVRKYGLSSTRITVNSN